MDVKARITALLGALIIFNIVLWVYAYVSFEANAKFLALCLMAYGFGLRHAVDADHIAAIDNTTRKFVQQDKQPVSIGFFFSLGHSTIVILLSLGVAAGAAYIQTHMSGFQNIGGIIGTTISALFLFILGIINLLIFIDTFKKFQHYKNKGQQESEDIEKILEQQGFLDKIFKPMFKLVSKPWHMYVVGFLFGLGFDTATEVALLGISATQAAQGVSVWAVMLFPLLFMAGMLLVDTLDGMLMLKVYRYAFINPLKKLYYNMVITFVSFVIAFFIGGIEALSVLSDNLHVADSLFWNVINALNNGLDDMGFYIIGFFALTWLLSMLVYNKFVQPSIVKQN